MFNTSQATKPRCSTPAVFRAGSFSYAVPTEAALLRWLLNIIPANYSAGGLLL